MSDAMHDLSEADLVEGLQRGDPAVFRQCFDRFYRDLVAFAFRLLGSREAAQDIVQDVFVGIFQRRQMLDTHGTLRAYLFSAVRNRALNALRHDGVAQRAADDSSTMTTPPAMGTAPLTPADITEQRDIHIRVRQALTTLPERQRAAMMLRWEYGLTTTEIGDALGITKAAAGQLLAKAAAHLRRALPAF